MRYTEIGDKNGIVGSKGSIMGKVKKYHLKTVDFTITPADENDLWETEWNIELRSDAERIGTVSFAGEKARGTVPFTIELSESYRNRGYGTEAIRMMVDGAFLHRNVYEVTAVTEHENDKAVHALEKAGFVYRSREGKTEYYSITKQKTSWLGLYVCIGILVGMILAIVLGSAPIGMLLGILICVAIGVGMDASENKARERVTGEKK